MITNDTIININVEREGGVANYGMKIHTIFFLILSLSVFMEGYISSCCSVLFWLYNSKDCYWYFKTEHTFCSSEHTTEYRRELSPQHKTHGNCRNLLIISCLYLQVVQTLTGKIVVIPAVSTVLMAPVIDLMEAVLMGVWMDSLERNVIKVHVHVSVI